MKQNKIKEVAVTGGKGGTGKSTYSIMLASELVKKGKRVVLCDCDVECPNIHLLLEQELENPLKQIYSELPTLNKEKCIKCGLCAKTCRNNAILQAKGKYPEIFEDLCSGCGACWLVCPNNAMDVKKERSGNIYLNKSEDFKNFWVITGESKEGLEETGPIVLKTKKYAQNFAEKKGIDCIIYDVAAGIHCPVIAAIMDCDMAYAVTEPTPMGAHDLVLILNLVKKLNVDFDVILNRSDIGDKKLIKKVLEKFNIEKIYREIPYSEKIMQTYARGMFLEYFRA